MYFCFISAGLSFQDFRASLASYFFTRKLYIGAFALDTDDGNSKHLCNKSLKPSLQRSEFMKPTVTRLKFFQRNGLHFLTTKDKFEDLCYAVMKKGSYIKLCVLWCVGRSVKMTGQPDCTLTCKIMKVNEWVITHCKALNRSEEDLKV